VSDKKNYFKADLAGLLPLKCTFFFIAQLQVGEDNHNSMLYY
jgi:uncharacterized membrane protein (GlpM family)